LPAKILWISCIHSWHTKEKASLIGISDAPHGGTGPAHLTPTEQINYHLILVMRFAREFSNKRSEFMHDNSSNSEGMQRIHVLTALRQHILKHAQ